MILGLKTARILIETNQSIGTIRQMEEIIKTVWLVISMARKRTLDRNLKRHLKWKDQELKEQFFRFLTTREAKRVMTASLLGNIGPFNFLPCTNSYDTILFPCFFLKTYLYFFTLLSY